MTRTVRGRVPGEDPPVVSGRLPMPASKSHTIRALLVAAFADGTSRLRRPLVSRDSVSCRAAVEALGARVRDDGPDWLVQGFGSRPRPVRHAVDVGNSGTTLYLATAMAALADEAIRFDGDAQIRRRSAAPLLDALEALGARVESAEGGCAPYSIRGPLESRSVAVDCPVSQYLSALLLAAPLIPKESGDSAGPSGVSTIKVNSLNEAPYVGITLDWLEAQGIRYERDGWDEFRIPAGQHYSPFDRVVPADWSSATFFMAAAAVTGGSVLLEGLDPGDSQGDTAVAGMLERMGCRVSEEEGGIRIDGAPLSGAKLDLNATPDALPALAVCACFAEGETRLTNVPQARMKETDRIAVMTEELLKLGVDVEERRDGMVIRGHRPARCGGDAPVLKGAILDGHDDHRVVMALAVAALGCCGEVGIRGAEAADVTFPGFFALLDRALGRGGGG